MKFSKKNYEHYKNNFQFVTKKSIIYVALVVIAITTVSFVNIDKKPLEKENVDSYSSVLNGIKEYTLQVAEAMPADKYTFKPCDSVRSFGEQMAHIGLSSQFLIKLFIDGEPMPTKEDFAATAKMEKELGISKEACIKTINEAFDLMASTHDSMDTESLKETFVVPFDPNQPKFAKEKAFQFIQEHIAHHRGQALVSLRMQGVKSPRYRLY